MKIFTGNANPALAAEIASALGVPLGSAEVTRFDDGETRVVLLESVRGADVFIIQPTCAPANEHLFELLVMIDACRRASAARIVCVIPYYGYGRQDRKDQPREPITAKLVADLLQTAGADRILTIELHAAQIMGFFHCPVDQLDLGKLFAEHLRQHEVGDCLDQAVVVSPDVGGVRAARMFADRLGVPLVIVAKRRLGPNQCEANEVIGDVNGRVCIMRDDMIDTGGSMIKGATRLLEEGACSVIGIGTHAVLSGDAPQRLAESSLDRVIVSDTIPVPESKRFAQLEVLPVAPVLAKAIKCVHDNQSVGALFRDP